MALTGSFITYGAGQIVSGVLGTGFRRKTGLLRAHGNGCDESADSGVQEYTSNGSGLVHKRVLPKAFCGRLL